MAGRQPVDVRSIPVGEFRAEADARGIGYGEERASAKRLLDGEQIGCHC
jgi:hypothetical protein